VPRVSVLIPAYNAERHLGRALESVAAQTYADWEAIVVDDGSTDATSSIAQGFPDERIVSARSPVNQGLAATRNLALARAQGDLVALLDSDDAWLPTYLEEQVALHDATGAAIVCCDAYLERDGHRLPERYGDRFGRPSDHVDVVELVRTNPIFISVVLTRSVVDEVGRFDERLRSVEDLDLWLRIVERGYRVAYNPHALVVYHLASGTLSTDVLRMTRSRQRVYRNLLRRRRLTSAQRRVVWRALAVQRGAELRELVRRGTACLQDLAEVAASRTG
jgi:glycosyltransferase involved in cell wall biosynthesis